MNGLKHEEAGSARYSGPGNRISMEKERHLRKVKCLAGAMPVSFKQRKEEVARLTTFAVWWATLGDNLKNTESACRLAMEAWLAGRESAMTAPGETHETR